MAFDGIVAKSIVNELKPLIGGKIDKIYEPDRNTIVLGIYYNGKNYLLNICIDSHNCRINLTTHSRVNPLVAPNFCMLLRKHLIGGRISNISMIGLERLINIEIETINEFNEIEVKTLVVELMGKHSNLILLNNKNTIIDAMRHISSENSYREILPSRYYTLPNSDKFDFMALNNFEDFYLKFVNISLNDLAKKIANTFTGFSLSFAQSVIDRCNVIDTSKQELEKVYNYFCDVMKKDSILNFEHIYKDNKVSDYVLTISNYNEPFHLNFFIDDFYFERETFETFINYKNTVLRMILEVLKKNSR